MYALESDWVWSSLIGFDLLWLGFTCFSILCMVLKLINSIGLQVIQFNPVWSALIRFKILCMVLKGVNSIGLQVIWFWSTLTFYVWSGKESIQLVYKWSGLICFDPVWSALKFYVWSWKESIQLVYKWSTLIHFKILCMVLNGVNSIGLQVIQFDPL